MLNLPFRCFLNSAPYKWTSFGVQGLYYIEKVLLHLKEAASSYLFVCNNGLHVEFLQLVLHSGNNIVPHRRCENDVGLPHPEFWGTHEL